MKNWDYIVFDELKNLLYPEACRDPGQAAEARGAAILK